MKLFEIYHFQGEDYLRFALSLTRHREEAEDLVQQTYVKALGQVELFEVMKEEQVKGWFFTTIKNQFIDQYRRSKKILTIPLDQQMLENLSEPVHQSSLEKRVFERIEVKEILDKLPEELKIPVIYRYILGYNSREISEILGINPSTLRSRFAKVQTILWEHKSLKKP